MRHGSPRLNEVGSATGFPKEMMIPQKASIRPGSGVMAVMAGRYVLYPAT
jgi:hypothetical protein